jgi:hypothetical protein
LFQFEAIALASHTLVRTAFLNVSHPLSVAITTPIALTTMLLVLCVVFQLMAKSTFDERLVHFLDRGVHVIACMQQSRRVSLSDSTHMPIVNIPLSHFVPILKRSPV